MKHVHPILVASVVASLTLAVWSETHTPDAAAPVHSTHLLIPVHVQAEPFLAGQWQEPYGGCDEAANYPGTPGFRQCARHGLLPHPTHSNHLLPSGGG